MRFLHVLPAALLVASALAGVSAQAQTAPPVDRGAAATTPAPPAMPPETVLADNGIARVTRADYDLELTKLPPNMRGGFAASEKRVVDLINRLLVSKTLAAQADARGIPKEPEVARRIESEFERLKSQLMTQRIEAEAGARFDANPAPFELRARDLYAVDANRYATPEQVSASHILFKSGTRTPEETRRLAEQARADVLAGADFEHVARDRSEDATAKDNRGRLGWFGPRQMDPAFEAATFALAKTGDLSEPVESAYGWHIIRLDGRRAARRPAFEEAKPRIMQDLRQQYVNAERDRMIDEIRAKAYESMNSDVVATMILRVDYDEVDRQVRETLRRAREKERPDRAK